ncbi:MAG: cache and HAMP domain-containing protein, partial [Rhodocyclaceae bacterium]|nr:cache and HAMP domain-containing protein [Rhodocyclaceae bacterium]
MNHDTNRNAGRFSVPFGSLQFKLTVAIMAVTLSFVWGLAIYAAATLQAQTRDVTMDAQFTMVEYLAAELDQKLKDRMTGLEGIARHLDLARLGDNAYLQQFLEQRYVLQQSFSGGTAIIAADGRALADYPITPGRRGTYFGDRDYVTQAATTRRSYIDKPVMGRTLKRPVLTMSTPLIDTAGEFKGVMTGIIDLTAADFLGLMADAKRLGSTEFYIISPRDGLFVTASDPKRIMTPLPAPGTSEIADSLSKGFEGSMVARSSQGITKLYSAKAVPTTGWVVELALPTEIAFRPAIRLRNTLYSSAALATLLALLVVAWMSRRLLKPLEDAAARLDDMSSGRQPLERLPENGDTEVHQLLGSFNRLIDHLGAQQAELRRNEVRLAASQRIAHVGSWEWEIVSNIGGVVEE